MASLNWSLQLYSESFSVQKSGCETAVNYSKSLSMETACEIIAKAVWFCQTW